MKKFVLDPILIFTEEKRFQNKNKSPLLPLDLKNYLNVIKGKFNESLDGVNNKVCSANSTNDMAKVGSVFYRVLRLRFSDHVIFNDAKKFNEKLRYISKGSIHSKFVFIIIIIFKLYFFFYF